MTATYSQPAPVAAETRARDVARLERELARARQDAATLERPDVGRPALAVQGTPGSAAPALPPVPPIPPVPNGADVRTTQLPGGAQIQSGPNGTTITGPDGRQTQIVREGSRTIIRSPDGNEVVVGPNGIIRGGPGATNTEVGYAPRNNDVPPEVVPIVGTIFGSIALMVIGFPIARAFARRMDRKAVPTSSPDVSGRLDRIEQAIEAIAVEVERVSEAQRYSARLLTERLPDAAALRASAAETVR